jgi:hypothetical protein
MRLIFPAVLATAALAACQEAPASPTSSAVQATAVSDVDHGRYLVKIGSCNDCHTPGFPQSGGNIPEAQWLTGSTHGYGGPWGVTYASNLRLSVANMTEDEFVTLLATRKDLPPMPWPSVSAMTENDKRAVYRYIHSLGPAGVPAPAALPPGVKATTPVENMMPVMPVA